MLGRKFFKTRLCKLYQGGRCPRANCSFAHGNSELRHAPGPPPPFNASASLSSGIHMEFVFTKFTLNGISSRRDYRSGDLRDKIERRYSPHRRHSPVRDARGYHGFHGQRPVSHDRGYSVSRSPVKRRHRKKQHLDDESDDSESLKRSSGVEDQKKDGKMPSYDEKEDFEEQLKKMQLDIEMLEDHKSQLELLLEEKVNEAHKLSNGIKDLEIQLNKEQEDCKRIMSKTKKFVKAHGRYMKAQEDLKRSQARLQKLGNQLGSDCSKPNANDEDSSEFASDGEPNSDKRRSPRNNELHNNTSIRKRQHYYTAASDDVQIGNAHRRKKFSGFTTKPEKFSRAEGPVQSDDENKETVANKGIHLRKGLTDEYRHKRDSLDKAKGAEVVQSLPSTGMAAHAVDELIEAVEIDQKSQAVGATAVDETEAAENKAVFSYLPPPPPPVSQNAYKQFQDDDEDVDVDVEKIDSEMVDIDLNCEVDIDQV